MQFNFGSTNIFRNLARECKVYEGDKVQAGNFSDRLEHMISFFVRDLEYVESRLNMNSLIELNYL